MSYTMNAISATHALQLSCYPGYSTVQMLWKIIPLWSQVQPGHSLKFIARHHLSHSIQVSPVNSLQNWLITIILLIIFCLSNASISRWFPFFFFWQVRLQISPQTSNQQTISLTNAICQTIWSCVGNSRARPHGNMHSAKPEDKNALGNTFSVDCTLCMRGSILRIPSNLSNVKELWIWAVIWWSFYAEESKQMAIMHLWACVLH